MTAALKVKCPICGKSVVTTDQEFPFCSVRCRTIDLGNWASEKYVISSPAISNKIIPDQDPSERHDED